MSRILDFFVIYLNVCDSAVGPDADAEISNIEEQHRFAFACGG